MSLASLVELNADFIRRDRTFMEQALELVEACEDRGHVLSVIVWLQGIEKRLALYTSGRLTLEQLRHLAAEGFDCTDARRLKAICPRTPKRKKSTRK